MLDRSRLRAALESRSANFQRYDRDRQASWLRLRDAFSNLAALGRAAIEQDLPEAEAPGALPTDELDAGLIRSFPLRFSNHPEAMAWAQPRLEGLTTFAADGSQIEPDNRLSIPVALVQVGSFENQHRAEGVYRKETELKVLTPDELDGEGPPKRLVDLARFELEIDTLIRFMHSEPSKPEHHRLVFMDGSLIVSFAEKQSPDAQARRYVDRILALLVAAKRTRTPLIAFVDGSRAKDLARMTAYASGEDPGTVTDAMLLEDRLAWGDRTAAFLCAREGILDHYGPHRRDIAFCYLQTRDGHPPARLEFPSWLIPELDRVLEGVLADVIAGSGYPYTLAAADATAVLTTSDRDRFQRTLEDFLSQRDIPILFSNKALSKLRRR